MSTYTFTNKNVQFITFLRNFPFNKSNFRKTFTVIYEEVFLLFSEKILAEVISFLEIENKLDVQLNKKYLQKHFEDNYLWTKMRSKEPASKLQNDDDVVKIDGKCQGLYEQTIFKSIADNNTFSFKKKKYPIKFKIEF